MQILCASETPEEAAWMHEHLFYGELPSTREAAKALCFRCPAQMRCLRYSLTSDNGLPESYGVWGGLAPAERLELVQHLEENGLEL